MDHCPGTREGGTGIKTLVMHAADLYLYIPTIAYGPLSTLPGVTSGAQLAGRGKILALKMLLQEPEMYSTTVEALPLHLSDSGLVPNTRYGPLAQSQE